MIERLIRVEEAYKKRKIESESDIHNAWNRKRYAYLKSKGICTECEECNLSDKEKKKNYSRCYKCRLKKRKQTAERKRLEKYLGGL
jgi:predicted metal-binding protein